MGCCYARHTRKLNGVALRAPPIRGQAVSVGESSHNEEVPLSLLNWSSDGVLQGVTDGSRPILRARGLVWQGRGGKVSRAVGLSCPLWVPVLVTAYRWERFKVLAIQGVANNVLSWLKVAV